MYLWKKAAYSFNRKDNKIQLLSISPQEFSEGIM